MNWEYEWENSHWTRTRWDFVAWFDKYNPKIAPKTDLPAQCVFWFWAIAQKYRGRHITIWIGGSILFVNTVLMRDRGTSRHLLRRRRSLTEQLRVAGSPSFDAWKECTWDPKLLFHPFQNFVALSFLRSHWREHFRFHQTLTSHHFVSWTYDRNEAILSRSRQQTLDVFCKTDREAKHSERWFEMYDPIHPSSEQGMDVLSLGHRPPARILQEPMRRCRATLQSALTNYQTTTNRCICEWVRGKLLHIESKTLGRHVCFHFEKIHRNVFVPVFDEVVFK